MIIKGSMGYTASGRRKKSYNSKRKIKDDGSVLSSSSNNSIDRDSFRSHDSNSPFKGQVGRATEDYLAERRAISSNYTIAPAYNKGAYQVIGKDNLEDIGK